MSFWFILGVIIGSCVVSPILFKLLDIHESHKRKKEVELILQLANQEVKDSGKRGV